MIQDILEIMRSGQVWYGSGFKRVDRNVLTEWTKMVNRVVSEIKTSNITDTNKLINATAIYIARHVGLKMGGCLGKERISVEKENQRLYCGGKQGKRKRKKKYTKLERKYNIKQKGENGL